jgi:hypothetical protein
MGAEQEDTRPIEAEIREHEETEWTQEYRVEDCAVGCTGSVSDDTRC